MKLYTFNPNTWGDVFTVLADNKWEALMYVKDFLKKEFNNEVENPYGCGEYYQKLYFLFENATVDKLPEEYTIDIYEVGKVMHTENS